MGWCINGLGWCINGLGGLLMEWDGVVEWGGVLVECGCIVVARRWGCTVPRYLIDKSYMFCLLSGLPLCDKLQNTEIAVSFNLVLLCIRQSNLHGYPIHTDTLHTVNSIVQHTLIRGQ